MLRKISEIPRAKVDRLLPVIAVEQSENGFSAVYLDPKDYGRERVPVRCSSHYIPHSIIWMRNGCCRKEPVLITTNEKPGGGVNFSGQCACGGWCTNGHDTPEACVMEYQRMTAHKDRYPELY